MDTYFEETIEKWTNEFLERPEVLFWSESNFGIIYRITYIVIDSKDILSKGSDFIHEIVRFQHAAK